MNDAFIIITCPHCSLQIIIYLNEINCHIFRHGIIKKTGLQIPPHETKEICDMLFNNDLIYGCGKSFILDVITKQPDKCDYI